MKISFYHLKLAKFRFSGFRHNPRPTKPAVTLVDQHFKHFSLPRLNKQIVDFFGVFQQRVIHHMIFVTINHEIDVSCHFRQDFVRGTLLYTSSSCSPCVIFLTGVITCLAISIYSKNSSDFMREEEHIHERDL